MTFNYIYKILNSSLPPEVIYIIIKHIRRYYYYILRNKLDIFFQNRKLYWRKYIDDPYHELSYTSVLKMKLNNSMRLRLTDKLTIRFDINKYLYKITEPPFDGHEVIAFSLHVAIYEMYKIIDKYKDRFKNYDFNIILINDEGIEMSMLTPLKDKITVPIKTNCTLADLKRTVCRVPLLPDIET